jgi:hypothetical protein
LRLAAASLTAGRADRRGGQEQCAGLLVAGVAGAFVLGAEEYRREMTGRFTTWNEVTGTATAA